MVGIGSSAGGLEALSAFFTALPSDSGMAFVLVQHLDPTHGSAMAELLGRCTSMPVVQVQGDTPVEPDHVYCIPPASYLGISGRTLRLTAPLGPGRVRMPVDFFLRALAADVQEEAIGIVLSGTGSDGTIGLQAIRATGGLAVVQEPATARHDGMPRSAIAAGAVDRIASPDGMPDVLFEHLQHAASRGAAPAARGAALARARLPEVLALLRGHVGFDFRSYKRGTLERRIGRRMDLRRIEDPADYLRVLVDEPAEAQRLFADLLINVTSFFRDPAVWDELRERVIRPLVRQRTDATPIRVWVPGCATGEEAYSIAMLLIEELESAERAVPLQVFASDVDTAALAFARDGLYAESVVAEVPSARRTRFFVDEGEGARVSKALRETVVFARHNLLLDPPYSRLDLVSCRNVLMYFTPAAQKQLLTLLHFSLLPGGHLLVGTAEGIGPGQDLFEVLSPKARIHRRVGPTRYDRVRFPQVTEALAGQSVERGADPASPAQFAGSARQLLLEHFAPACVLINRRHEILYFAGPTNDYLVQPTGVPTHDLLARVRDGLPTKLRAAIRSVFEDGERRVVSGAHVRRGGRRHRVQMTVEPFRMAREPDGLVLVSFVDAPAVPPLAPNAGAGDDRAELGTAELEAELKRTRDDLQGMVAELESSNQELKIANEEIVSVNEELRSSNEELETSKEELNSLNEELRTVNAQLEDRVRQLQQVNDDLDNLLTSTNIATIFLDTRLRVRRFTPVATRLFHLIGSDVGRPITALAQRCLDPDLRKDAERVLSTRTSVSKEIEGADGRWLVRQVLPYRAHDDHVDGVVVTFSDVAAEAIQEARLYAEAIVDAVREPLLVLDAHLRVQSANRAFYAAFGLAAEATVGHAVGELRAPDRDAPALPELIGDVLLSSEHPLTNVELEHEVGPGNRRTLLLNTRTLVRGGERADLLLLSLEDITERTRVQRLLRESEAMTRAGVRTAVDGSVTIDEHGTVLSFNPAAADIFGYAEDEVLGRSVTMLLPADEDAGTVHALRPDDPTFLDVGHEARGRRKDGTTFPLDLHVGAFEDGLRRRFVATLRDVTERKRIEEDGRRHQAELAHVLRVATIEHLASGLAHELNQPLTAIANQIEACATWVRAGPADPQRLLASLESAGAEALRAGGIVHHLREFVQRTPAQREATDLSAVVRNALQWFTRAAAEAAIVVRVALATASLPVCVDRIQIEQVLVNLLQNAIDALADTPAEGRVIDVRTTHGEDGEAEVAIDDTGCGFHAGVAERLFEPYFTTKRGGLGLGLAISRSIVEMHDGRLALAPHASGPGAAVRMRLPLLGLRTEGAHDG